MDWDEKTGEQLMCRCCGSDNQAVLFPCSNCPATFCKKCLSMSLGRPRLTPDWRCLLCFSLPLRNFKLGLLNSPAAGQGSASAKGGPTARNKASPGPVPPVVRGKGPKVPPARGKATSSARAPSDLRQNTMIPGEVRPRLMLGMGPRMVGLPRMIGSPAIGSRRMGSPGISPRWMGPPSIVGPRTPINRPLRLRQAGPRPRYPTSPMQVPMPSVEGLDKTTEEMNPLPAVSNDWEDPTSDPLAEVPVPSLTYQEVPSDTSGPLDVNQNHGRVVKCATMPSAMKRPRMMADSLSPGGFKASPGARMPPGPRMWKSPAPSPLLQGSPSGLRMATRPLFNVVSKPFHVQAAEVEVINVEEEVKNNMEEVLQNLPSTVTLIRTNEASFTLSL